MKNLSITIVLVFISLLFASCAKDTLIEKPPHVITSETLYTSVAGFEAGLNGLYAMARQIREGVGQESGHALRGAMFMLGTDNAVTNHQNVGFCMTAQLWKGNNNAQDQELIAVFDWLYSVVNAANTIIDHAEKPEVNWVGGSGTETENKNLVIANARAIRAWAYRYLTAGWGDVPLNLHESTGSNIRTDWERTPVEEVRKQIISDFVFAQQYIPVEPEMRGRLTKGAVQHYLAEMYLVVNKPDSTLYWSNQVINNSAYALVTERYGVKKDQRGSAFMDMFYDGNSNREEGNKEALWVFQFAQSTIGGGSALMRRYIASRYWKIQIGSVTPFQPTSDRGGYGFGRMAFTKWALGLYDPNDDRGTDIAIRKYFILKNAQQNSPAPADRLPGGYNYGDTIHLDWSSDITYTHRGLYNWPYSRKFDDGTDVNNPIAEFTSNDQIYLRLAETYFLKAEAQLKLGDVPGATETVNTIRRRSHAADISSSQMNLDFILDERSRELFLEEDRRITLLRTSKWLERTRLHNNNGGANIAERDTLYPIPQPVIDANLTKKMTQNPGYN